MNLRGLKLSDLVTRLRSMLFDPLQPIPSLEKHEEYLGDTAQKIMSYQGEGNVLLSAGQVEMGDGHYTENS